MAESEQDLVVLRSVRDDESRQPGTFVSCFDWDGRLIRDIRISPHQLKQPDLIRTGTGFAIVYVSQGGIEMMVFDRDMRAVQGPVVITQATGLYGYWPKIALSGDTYAIAFLSGPRDNGAYVVLVDENGNASSASRVAEDSSGMAISSTESGFVTVHTEGLHPGNTLYASWYTCSSEPVPALVPPPMEIKPVGKAHDK